MEYIKLEDLKDGYLYRIHARNASYGIYRESVEGFIISRYKFGFNYTFEEYYRDDRPFGTAGPLKEIEKSPFKRPDKDAIVVEKVHSNGKKFWEAAKEDEILEYLNRQLVPESTSDDTAFCKRCKLEFVVSAMLENGLCNQCDITRQKKEIKDPVV